MSSNESSRRSSLSIHPADVTPSSALASASTTAAAHMTALHQQPHGAAAVPMSASNSSTGSIHSSLPPSARTQVTADPLSRTYPKPDEDINVAEALAREPRKWTLGYWAKNARDLPQSGPPSSAALSSAALSSRKFEETKNELRRAREEMATQWSTGSGGSTR